MFLRTFFVSRAERGRKLDAEYCSQFKILASHDVSSDADLNVSRHVQRHKKPGGLKASLIWLTKWRQITILPGFGSASLELVGSRKMSKN